LDAQHSGKGHTGCEAQAGVQLGPVQPERLDLDEHPASRRRRNWELADRQRIGRARRVEDDRTHGVRHPTLLGSDTRLGAVAYTFTRSPDAADLSMAAMTSWRRTASAKSGTVRFPLSMSAANAAYVRPTLKAGTPCRLESAGHFSASAAGAVSSAISLRPCAPATVNGKIPGSGPSAVIRSVPPVPLISHRNPVPPATASRTWTLAVTPEVRVPITPIWSAAVFTICSPVSSMVMSGRRRPDTADRSANSPRTWLRVSRLWPTAIVSRLAPLVLSSM